MLGPLAVPLSDELQQQGVVLQGDLGQGLLVRPGGDGRLHRPVDHGQQAHHKFVVGRPDDGGVKGPVRPSAVRPTADAVGHRLPLR